MLTRDARRAARGTPIPAGASLADRLLAYFRRNPDEADSAHDLALKFDADIVDIRAALAAPVARGEVVASGKGPTALYGAGPKLVQAPAQPELPAAPAAAAVTAPVTQAAPASAAPAAPAPRKHRKAVPPLDLSQVQIRNDVPVPKIRNALHQRGNVYRELLQRLQVGESAELPAQYQDSLSNTARKMRNELPGARFVFRTLDRNRCGVWRTA